MKSNSRLVRMAVLQALLYASGLMLATPDTASADNPGAPQLSGLQVRFKSPELNPLRTVVRYRRFHID